MSQIYVLPYLGSRPRGGAREQQVDPLGCTQLSADHFAQISPSQGSNRFRADHGEIYFVDYKQSPYGRHYPGSRHP